MFTNLQVTLACENGSPSLALSDGLTHNHKFGPILSIQQKNLFTMNIKLPKTCCSPVDWVVDDSEVFCIQSSVCESLLLHKERVTNCIDPTQKVLLAVDFSISYQSP